LATPIDSTHHVLSARAHNKPQYIGKGRQLQALQISHLYADRYGCRCNARAGYVLYRALAIIIFFTINLFLLA
jgi:hypothetical protein